jgi:Polysaccharide deacetylase
MGLASRSKRAVKKGIVRSGRLRAAGRLAQPSAVILMYHSVVEEPQRTANSIRISQSRVSFESQMSALARRFDPVTIEQVVRFAAQGRPLPRWPVAVTFDDGFADNYEVVLPILSRYGVPATFYITVNAVQTGTPPWYCRLNFAFSSTTRPEWCDPEHGEAAGYSELLE